MEENVYFGNKPKPKSGGVIGRNVGDSTLKNVSDEGSRTNFRLRVWLLGEI